jgi:alpha-1,6-mannosyltransferase
MDARRLNRWICGLGAIQLVCCALHAVLSYGMAPVAPFGTLQPREAATFRRLGEAVALFGESARGFVTGRSFLAERAVFLWASGSLLAISSAAFVALLILLARHHPYLDRKSPRLVAGWTIAFVAASVLAVPVFAQDFWLTLAWGKMVARGANPYYAGIPPAILDTLPLDYARARMTYGPLWALVAGLVMRFAGEHTTVAALVFKLLLAGAFVGSLRLIGLLLAERPLWHQCTGLALFGWMPVTVTQSVAEGHNDVLMVLLLLLWLHGRARDRHGLAALWLTASALIKYVTAPLLLLEILPSRGAPGRIRGFLLRGIFAGLLALAAFAPFYRSADYFAPVLRMGKWRFFTPGSAVLAFSPAAGIDLFPLALAVEAFFPALALVYLWNFFRHPRSSSAAEVALAVLCGVLFSLVGHVWPWFLIWVLAPGAALPWAPLTRWVAGVGLASPFATLLLTAYPGKESFGILAAAIYLGAVAWFALSPRRWFPPAPDPGSSAAGDAARASRVKRAL